MQVPKTDLWREIQYTPVGRVKNAGGGGGWWENETWAKLAHVKTVIAVIHTAYELHLKFDDYFFDEECSFENLSQYGQNCHTFMLGIWHMWNRDFWQCFPSIPELTAFYLNHMYSSLDPMSVMKPWTQLSSL